MRQDEYFFLVIADRLMYPGKSYRERERYRRDLHRIVEKKFTGYADRKFRSSAEATLFAREIQKYFNVTFDIVSAVDVY